MTLYANFWWLKIYIHTELENDYPKFVNNIKIFFWNDNSEDLQLYQQVSILMVNNELRSQNVWQQRESTGTNQELAEDSMDRTIHLHVHALSSQHGFHWDQLYLAGSFDHSSYTLFNKKSLHVLSPIYILRIFLKKAHYISLK